MANDNYRQYKTCEAANEILKHKAEVVIPTNAYLNGLAKRYGITTKEALDASKWLESKKSGNDAFPDDSANIPCNTDCHDSITNRSGLVLFDEVGSDSKIDWSALIRMISNGVGKPRMSNDAGGYRSSHTRNKSAASGSDSLISKLIGGFDASTFPAQEVSQ
jgi:hypothetical protein